MAKRTTTIGTRLDAALLALQLGASGPAVDPTRDVVNSGKAETQVPRDFDNEHGVWLERAERLVEGIVAVVQGTREAQAQKTVADLRAVIRTYEGRNTVYVAFHEGCSVRTVERARVSLGLEPSTGFRAQKVLRREVAIYEADMGQDGSRQDGTIDITSQSTLSGGDDDQ